MCPGCSPSGCLLDAACPQVSVLGSPGHSSAMVLWSMARAHGSDFLGKGSTTGPSTWEVCSLHLLLLLLHDFLLCAILHSPAPLLPVTFSLLLGLAESQGSFYFFRTACWRYLRWLPRYRWKSKEKKNLSQSRLYWEMQLYCYIAVGIQCITMLLKSVLSRVTELHR